MNAVEREPVSTRVLNPNASEASYKPKQRSYQTLCTEMVLYRNVANRTKTHLKSCLKRANPRGEVQRGTRRPEPTVIASSGGEGGKGSFDTSSYYKDELLATQTYAVAEWIEPWDSALGDQGFESGVEVNAR